MLRIVGGDSKQETYVVTHTTSGIYILILVSELGLKLSDCSDYFNVAYGCLPRLKTFI